MRDLMPPRLAVVLLVVFLWALWWGTNHQLFEDAPPLTPCVHSCEGGDHATEAP